MVVCRQCQHDSSDPLFCDRCNSLLPEATTAVLPSQVRMRDGRLLDCSEWQGVWPTDCWRPLHAVCAGRPYRLYGLGPGWWRELSAVVQERAAFHLDVLAPLEVIPVEDGAIIVAEGLPGAVRPLTAALTGDELERLDGALAACRILAGALDSLHRAGLVWLSFDPESLEVSETGVRLTNLDLHLFHAGACPDTLRLSSAYSPPEVCGFRADRIGPATDVFHTCLYLYYRLAYLLPDGFPGQGLEAFDFDIPPLRIYWPHLPVGIAPVLERGLARDPSQPLPHDGGPGRCADGRRRESAAAAHGDGRRCLEVRQRHRDRPIARTARPAQPGQLHRPVGVSRREDSWLLAVVADGVTHARVGSGEVASQAAVEVLSCRLPGVLREARTDAATGPGPDGGVPGGEPGHSGTGNGRWPRRGMRSGRSDEFHRGGGRFGVRTC